MNHLQRYLVEEFVEDYTEGRLSRREALKLIASVTGSLLVANTLLAACTPTAPTTPPTEAAASTPAPTAQAGDTPESATEAATSTAPAVSGTVAPDDPAIEAGPVDFPGQEATLMGYLARPVGDGPFPVVLVCHENRGLTEHIQDVTRRLAKAGYVSLAVDLLSRQGGSAAVGSGNAPGALGNMSPDQIVQDFRSAWEYLQGRPYAQADRLGMVGFCFGGGVTWLVATHMPELKAAVPFYGPHPPAADVPNINAAVLAVYGGLDQRINAGIPAIESAMQQNNKVYEKVIYPDADHAFHNDTGPRYNPEAARDAWARTLDWFATYLV